MKTAFKDVGREIVGDDAPGRDVAARSKVAAVGRDQRAAPVSCNRRG